MHSTHSNKQTIWTPLNAPLHHLLFPGCNIVGWSCECEWFMQHVSVAIQTSFNACDLSTTLPSILPSIDIIKSPWPLHPNHCPITFSLSFFVDLRWKIFGCATRSWATSNLLLPITPWLSLCRCLFLLLPTSHTYYRACFWRIVSTTIISVIPIPSFHQKS